MWTVLLQKLAMQLLIMTVLSSLQGLSRATTPYSSAPAGEDGSRQ